MNKLFIIGNGFDLAHGFKTRYSDFLLWYLNKTVTKLIESQSYRYEDGLVVLESSGYQEDKFDSFKSYKEYFNRSGKSFKCKYTFFQRLLEVSNDSNWVDIEYEYYNELLRLYRSVAKHNMGKYDGAERFVIDVNNCLDLIKIQLTEYLQTIEIESFNNEIESRFKNELNKTSFNNILFLVFNYTNTIELYLKSNKMKSHQLIYIHGQLNDDSNPIIFGYGDEMDEYYAKIESMNLNEFLKNMKSFSYLKTNNYRNLNRFITDSDFTVSIMGHSCGLSDRVLLNSIFCHQNCRGIRIYYYRKHEDENDFFEKTQEISRHFAFEHKNKMRNLIVPFSDSYTLS